MIARYHAEQLRAALSQFPAVVVTGARQTGKTTLAKWLWPDATYVTLDYPALAEQARLTPEAFLRAHTEPLILDEVQYAPEVFRHLKILIDQDRRPGRFLLTGSQSFGLMAGVSESLAGRAAIFSLPSLSLEEIATAPTHAETDAFLWRGGYPELWQRPDLDRDTWMASYIATYLERDVRQLLHVGDLRDFDRFLRATASRAGHLLSYAELARDVGIAPNTAKRWMSVLEASQQVFLLEPFHRQRTKRLVKTPKVYFADTGLLCFLQGFRQLSDITPHANWGHVWENFVIAEVRKRLLASAHPPPCWFWRTANGDEVDLLIETAPETFVAIECKTSERVTRSDLRGITKLTDDYGTTALHSARIVCRTERAYPLNTENTARAVPVGGAEGILREVGGLV